MTKEIIKKYGIDFQNKIDSDGIIDKFPGSGGDMHITALLYEWTSVDDLNDSLIADIDEALANPNSEIEAGSTPVLIVIQQDIVDFYSTWSDGVFSMPTKDLREIVIAWRDFLLTSPLNDPMVWTPLNLYYLLVAKLRHIFN